MRPVLVPFALAAASALPIAGGCGSGGPGKIGETGAPPWPVSFEVDPARRPTFERVVVVTIDTLRADHLSCYGYRRPTSPFLDRLAAEGGIDLFVHAQYSL